MKSIMSDFDKFSKVWFESTVFNSTANELLIKKLFKLLLEVEKLKKSHLRESSVYGRDTQSDIIQ
jgi:hypothetical protein